MTVAPALTAEDFFGGPQPTLRGDGLVLRPWRSADAPAALRAFADPDIQRWHVRSLSRSQASPWIEERRGRWEQRVGVDWAVVADGDEDAVLGRMGMNRVLAREALGVVAYWVLPQARGRRVAPRALEVMADWAFTAQGIHRLVLEHSVANQVSCGVAQRCGFALEGVERRAVRHADGWHDMHLHARLADDPPPPLAG